MFYFTFLQSIEYRAAMECLQKADRRSLLSEIQALRAQMSGRKMTLKREQESDQASQGTLCGGSSDSASRWKRFAWSPFSFLS